jgi:hypothetical protein
MPVRSVLIVDDNAFIRQALCESLAKCNNPSCSALFRSLQDGRLFRLESNPVLRTDNSNRVEYFWLYDRCASRVTLGLGEDGTVVAVPLPKPSSLSGGVIPVSFQQKNGLLLRSISSLLSEHLRDRRRTRLGDARAPTPRAPR